MLKPLVILPTFNEKDNLPVLIIKILSQESFDILVIDDNSTDGTSEVARHWVAQDERVNLMERPSKLGLGTAYLSGFRWGLQRDYDCFIEMDSDLSHNALDLPRFLDEVENGCDLVIGSRYMHGRISVVGWDFKRLLLSKFGNLYASKILGITLNDMTSGYRAYSRRALESINLQRVKSEGYAFQIEMAYLVVSAGLKAKEMSIVFSERQRGRSKMNKQIVREAVWLPWRLRLREMAEYVRRRLDWKNASSDKKTGGPDD